MRERDSDSRCREKLIIEDRDSDLERERVDGNFRHAHVRESLRAREGKGSCEGREGEEISPSRA